MRARNVKPGFFKNEILADCDPLARILFAGLWCMADREGRLEYRPKRIKAEVLPYDNCNVEKLITQLSSKYFIRLYSVNNENYIEILNFRKHQNCHIKEAVSTIPAPGETGAGMEVARPLTDSLLPLTDSLSPTVQARYGELFKKFWEAYPKKKSKGQAEKAWLKIKPDEQLLASIIAMIARAKKSEEWQQDGGKYIPHPATWLYAKGWEDDITAPQIKEPQTQRVVITLTCPACGREAMDIIDGHCWQCFQGGGKSAREDGPGRANPGEAG